MKKLVIGLIAVAVVLFGINETFAGSRDRSLPYGSQIADGAVTSWEYNYPKSYAVNVWVEGTAYDDGRSTPIRYINWELWKVSGDGLSKTFYKKVGKTETGYFNIHRLNLSKAGIEKGGYQLKGSIYYKNGGKVVWFSKPIIVK